MKKEIYDWAAYYEKLYRVEKKNTNYLAARLADEDRKVGDLQAALQRVEGSIFWKLSKPVRLAGKVATGKVDVKKIFSSRTPRQSTLSNEIIEKYEEKLRLQEKPFLAWEIKHNNDIDSFCKENSELDRSNIEVLDWDTPAFLEECNRLINKNSEQEEEYLLFKLSCCELTQSCKKVLSVYASIHPNANIFYWDEENWLKPEFSIETLFSYFCLGSGILVKKQVVESFLKTTNSTGLNLVYELAFYCLEGGSKSEDNIIHVPFVLSRGGYLEEQIPGCDKASVCVRQKALEKRNIQGYFEIGQDGKIYQFVPNLYKQARVSAVILSKDHPEVLERLLASINEKTDFDGISLELIVVDNGSNNENKKVYETLGTEYDFKYIHKPSEFNFSAMCNLGAKYATGNVLLLLNDDIEVLHKDWLRYLTGYALMPSVGAVGAKLLYAGTDKIQHAGVTNLAVGPSHKLVTFSDDEIYYHGANLVIQNMLAVTAACLMIEKSKYDSVGGLNEDFKVAYNDVEFCFKLSEMGYRNLQCNAALLYHYESLTRGLDEDSDEKWDRLLNEKERLYNLHQRFCGKDPYYNGSLVDNAPDYRIGYKFPFEDHLCTVELQEQTGNYVPKSTNENIMKLTVDHAKLQRKIHNSEKSIIWIDGWVYLVGIDNAGFEKTIVLRNEDGSKCYLAEPHDRYREDVVGILPGETNVGLAGFSIRFDRDNIEKGSYQIGLVLSRDKEKYFSFSDKKLEIK